MPWAPSGQTTLYPPAGARDPGWAVLRATGELVVLCTWIAPPPRAHTPHAHLKASIYMAVSAPPPQCLSGLNTQHLTSVLQP